MAFRHGRVVGIVRAHAAAASHVPALAAAASHVPDASLAATSRLRLRLLQLRMHLVSCPSGVQWLGELPFDGFLSERSRRGGVRWTCFRLLPAALHRLLHRRLRLFEHDERRVPLRQSR